MIRARRLTQLLPLLGGALVALVVGGVVYKKPISAFDGTLEAEMSPAEATGWSWSTQASSGAGYSWSEGRSELSARLAGPSTAGYFWASGTPEE